MGGLRANVHPTIERMVATACTGITVTGCVAPSLGEIVNGTYKVHGENNGKQVFKREKDYQNTPVLIYYWKEEEEELSGWWFAPTIGDDFAWAQTTERSSLGDHLPPETGWHVPHDGDVDPNMRVVCQVSGKKSSEKAKEETRAVAVSDSEESDDEEDEESDAE